MNCDDSSVRRGDRYPDYSSAGESGWCGVGEDYYNENYLPNDSRHIAAVSGEHHQSCNSYFDYHHNHNPHQTHHLQQGMSSPSVTGVEPITTPALQTQVSNFPKKRTPSEDLYTIAIAGGGGGGGGGTNNNNNNNYEPKSPSTATSPWSYHSFYQKNPSSPNTSLGSSPPPNQLAPSGLQGGVGSCGAGSPKPLGRPSFKRRTTANKKERRRTQSINNAFAELRDCIPNVPADTKLSKIKTLRLATSYIAYLSEVLSGDDPLRTPQAFTAEISKKMGRGDEKRRKELLMQELAGAGVKRHEDNRKSKGRTGWPQHVWALELQQ